jgi:hypothetical protein
MQQLFSPQRTFIGLLGAAAALFIAAAFNPAQAVTVSVGDILPGAVSDEYFGLNFAINIETSSTVGTLNYAGKPGCGGTCFATTKLGASPSVFVTVNEVEYQHTGGGQARGSLGYYVAYLNAPGTYNVNLHAIDSLIAPDTSYVSTHLAFGKAGTSFGSMHNFDGALTFEEANCVNGCPAPGFVSTVIPGPFAPDHLLSIDANTLYFIQLDVLLNPATFGTQLTGMVDPTFSAAGGQFVFSPGVFSAAAVTPLPAALPLFAAALGGLGLLGWRRRKSAG